VPCSECERRALYRIELPGEKTSARGAARHAYTSDLLGTGEIQLATMAPGPWYERDTGLMLNEVARHSWRFGKAPLVRVLTPLLALSPG
jgi:hypothetical protein